ncbi:helix-turn-helix domain-containing protein [Raoultibacter massiliensis]|uniref:helix-turn-helix domain-containing protein n=1 Tax=Raoultibacter massiliensis TaxID=1852371 RepID=UPI0015E0D09B|nr:helix-turn-helix transcriptional regulator [Raoultibacter massiliensis]
MTSNIRLLRSLQWPYLGYAFLWTTVFVGASPVVEFVELDVFCGLAQLGASIIAIVVFAWILRSRFSVPSWHAFPCGIVLALGASVFYIAPNVGFSPLATNLVGSILTGAAAGYFYIMWQQFFASEGEGHTSIYIPLSGILSVALIAAASAVPPFARMVLAVVVFPSLATYSLWKSLGAIVVIRSEAGAFQSDESTLLKVVHTVSDLRGAIICCSALGFSWEFASTAIGGQVDLAQWVFIASQCLAVLLASVIIFTRRTAASIQSVYRAVFPLLLASILYALVAMSSFSFAVATGCLVFASELMSMLLLYVVAVYSSSRELPPSPVYAACMVPMYVSMWIGQLVAMAIFSDGVSGASVQNALAVVAFLIAVAVLVIPGKAFFASNGLRGSAGDPVDGASVVEQGKMGLSTVEGLSETLLRADLVDPLTYRECEVTLHILHGNSVAAVSKKLFISDNTTRSHIKNIYRKIGVHSRQELVDFIDGIDE